MTVKIIIIYSDVIFEPLKHLYEKRIRKQLNVVNEGKPQNKNKTNKRAITDYITHLPRRKNKGGERERKRENKIVKQQRERKVHQKKTLYKDGHTCGLISDKKENTEDGD